mmetsp:Transcript_5260/g.8115  ORF Transcript_5260/g.8115 Transcript_5260/m.8115 type:complete len:83 (+) Transcript_5260:924-1172(+)
MPEKPMQIARTDTFIDATATIVRNITIVMSIRGIQFAPKYPFCNNFKNAIIETKYIVVLRAVNKIMRSVRGNHLRGIPNTAA